LKRIIPILRRTLLWKDMEHIQNALSTQTKCGRKGHAFRRENGNILDQDVIYMHAKMGEFIFMLGIIHLNALNLVKKSILECMKVVG
jgi:hypothetical protein